MNNCSVCHNPREFHHQDKDGVWWCCDNISVRASFKINSKQKQLGAKETNMNHASKEIVNQITGSLALPTIGLTLTQEEADAIKEYVRVRYFEENVQGAVHSGFVRS